MAAGLRISQHGRNSGRVSLGHLRGEEGREEEERERERERGREEGERERERE